MVTYSTAKWSITVLCLLLVSCSTTKQTSRSLTTDYIGVQNWRLSDTLDLYYFQPLRTGSGNNGRSDQITSDGRSNQITSDGRSDQITSDGRSDLVTSDTKRPLQPYARIIRHATANVEDTTRYQVNEQKQVTTAKQPPDPMLDTGRKIVLSLIIFFGFVFISLVVLVIIQIMKLVHQTGSQ